MVPYLRKFRTLLFLLAISAVFSDCGKSSFKWLHYDETVCADRWEYSMNNEKLKDNVTSYLDKKGIKLFEIEIFIDFPPDGCADCTCKTGRRFKVKIKNRDLSDIKKEGFYE